MNDQINHSYNDEKYHLIKLEEIYEALDVSQGKFEAELARIRQGWKGNSTDVFLRKADIINQRIKKDTAEIQQVITDIRKISQIMHDAEEKNKIIAQE